jgi:hypothetical protein
VSSSGRATPGGEPARLRVASAGHARAGRFAPVPVHRVRKAYEQVGDQLRELILAGELAAGQRLPNEALLAHEFGVSRAAIREALRRSPCRA